MFSTENIKLASESEISPKPQRSSDQSSYQCATKSSLKSNIKKDALSVASEEWLFQSFLIKDSQRMSLKPASSQSLP